MNLRKTKNSGLTLAELIIAMWVMAIILTAVASLAFALSSANDSADNTAEFQTRFRFTSYKVTELIKMSRLICDSQANRIAVWANDDNGDDCINPGELVYIDSGSDGHTIRLLEFACSGSAAAAKLSIADIKSGHALLWLKDRATWNYTTLIDGCDSVNFSVDTAAPFSKRVTLTFSVNTKGIARTYQIDTALRCWAGRLLDKDGNLRSDDDE